MTTSQRDPAETDDVSRSAMRGGEDPVQRRLPGGSVASILAALLLGALLGAGSLYLLDRGGDADPFGGQIRTSTYQAVILSNDKVYFGQLRQVSDDFYQLRRAFFLQEARGDETSEPVRAVVPLIRELHAPENSMLIRSDEVVLIENLDEDSPVLGEIRRQNREQQ